MTTVSLDSFNVITLFLYPQQEASLQLFLSHEEILNRNSSHAIRFHPKQSCNTTRRTLSSLNPALTLVRRSDCQTRPLSMSSRSLLRGVPLYSKDIKSCLLFRCRCSFFIPNDPYPSYLRVQSFYSSFSDTAIGLIDFLSRQSSRIRR